MSKLFGQYPKDKKGHDDSEGEVGKTVYKAIIIACVIGILITLLVVGLSRNEEYFSVLYIQPGSYSNYVEGDYTEFIYGIENHRQGYVNYELDIYLGDELVESEEIGLKRGKEYRKKKRIMVGENLEFPTKLQLILRSDDKEYETHYWLKGRA